MNTDSLFIRIYQNSQYKNYKVGVEYVYPKPPLSEGAIPTPVESENFLNFESGRL